MLTNVITRQIREIFADLASFRYDNSPNLRTSLPQLSDFESGMFVQQNVDDMIELLHEPIDLITDFTIRSVIKSTIKSEITAQVEAAKNGSGSGSTAEDIMDEVGMDDAYFTNFSNALYDASNETNATIESVSDVLYE